MGSGLFSNPWWTYVWNTYSMSILGFPTIIYFLLQLLAIFHPNVPSDKIIDLIKQYWPTGPTPRQAEINTRQDTVDRMQKGIDVDQKAVNKEEKED